MPVEYTHHPDPGLIVITLCGHPPAFELNWWVDLLTTDPALPTAAPVLVLVRDSRHPPPVHELPEMARLAARVRERFGRRLAVVTTAVGLATVTQLLVLLVGTADRLAAFHCEQKARGWLFEPAK